MWLLSFRGTYLSQCNAFNVHPRRRRRRGSLLPPGCGSFGCRPRSDQPPADGRAGGSVSPLLGRPQGARRTESGGPDVTLVGQTPSRVSGAARRSGYQFRGTPVPLTLRPPRPRRRPHARPRGPRRPPRGAGSPAGCFWGHRGHSCFVSLPSPPPPRYWGGPLTPCASFAGLVSSFLSAVRPLPRPLGHGPGQATRLELRSAPSLLLGDTRRWPRVTRSGPRAAQGLGAQTPRWRKPRVNVAVIRTRGARRRTRRRARHTRLRACDRLGLSHCPVRVQAGTPCAPRRPGLGWSPDLCTADSPAGLRTRTWGGDPSPSLLPGPWPSGCARISSVWAERCVRTL